MATLTRCSVQIRRIATNKWFLICSMLFMCILSIRHTFHTGNYVVYFHNDSSIRNFDNLHNITDTRTFSTSDISNNTSVIYNSTTGNSKELTTISTFVAPTKTPGLTPLAELLLNVHPSISSLIQPRKSMTAAEQSTQMELILLINQSLSVNNSEVMPPGTKGTAYYENLSKEVNHTLLNNQQYSVTLMPSGVCDSDDIFLLIYVHTAPGMSSY